MLWSFSGPSMAQHGAEHRGGHREYLVKVNDRQGVGEGAILNPSPSGPSETLTHLERHWLPAPTWLFSFLSAV